jgi:pyruvate/2-oxoglutarate dehydrogenase complex dihydrolipoamide dehydrogenase (E3) component
LGIEPCALTPANHEHDPLLSYVHPPGWKNPTPASTYDLVVIGGGTAGLVSAAGAAGLGARVALVERALLGGDCLHTGCVPSKALLRSARVVHEARSGEGAGVAAATSVDFDAVMKRLRDRRASIAPHDSAERFAALGVDIFFGDAAFADERTVTVTITSKPDAVPYESIALRFRRAVIATGSRPAVPPIAWLEQRAFLTSETLFALTERPRRMLVIGAGPIGCEMAQAFALLGTAVTLADTSTRVLPREDVDASATITRALERAGVTLALGAAVSDAAADETVLVATGRMPNLERLNLGAAKVEATDRGVSVDDHLRTTNRRIYAAGDVCSPFRFTHAADAMARIVIQNALFHGRKRASDLVIPSCTYTFPEVAHVGADTTEGELITIPLSDIDRSIVDDETDGFIRIRHQRGRISGATIVAPHAGEVIGHVAHVMRTTGTLGDLSATIFPYPSVAEGLRKAGDAYRRGTLTPAMRRILQRYFALTRQ